MSNIQSEGRGGPPAGAPRRSRQDHAWALLAVVVLLVGAALIWSLIGKIGEGGQNQTTALFAEINFPPLIRGDGLGDGSTTLQWPADLAAPTPPRAGGEGGSDTSGELPPPARSGNSSSAAVGLRSEGPAVAMAGVTFGALDLNGDGRMSPAEFAIYRAASAQPSEKGGKADDMPPYVATSALNKTIGELREFDQDNDWFLGRWEFATAARRASHVQFR